MPGTADLGKTIAIVACSLLLVVPIAAAPSGTTPSPYDTVACGSLTEDTGIPIEGQTTTRTCSPDSDGDGVTDPGEVAVGSNPRVSDGGKDADGDGLPNRYEVKTGLNPNEQNDRTKALDHDGDEIPDRVEMEHGLSPYEDSTTGTDSDGDGLPDGVERTFGTDRTDADTDGDGFTDHAELTEHKKLPNADPLHKDLYYEVDRMEGHRLGAETKREAKALFERVALSNPDGERGITVHFVADDVIEHESPVEFSSAKYDLDGEHRDHEARGYHYLVVADNLTLRDDSGYDGAANERLDIAMVQSNASGQTVVHETGHLLGLPASAYDGIDSERYSADEYPSVMNYNYVNLSEHPEYPVFSDGSAGPNDHDDIARIKQNLARTYAPEVNRNRSEDDGHAVADPAAATEVDADTDDADSGYATAE